ncbi:sulfatase-like hydrolase/transferase [Streptomyces sp. NBC_00193]|uniref:sulfatase-like hydrolase/transferase n=1 Tax=Streptomyces sp. NBC_00193 TaxID=2975675 RepID=UPI002B1E258D|nr:sulfatase-like hydrolase/transferase [Streptomyces sp. NBC_00193]
MSRRVRTQVSRRGFLAGTAAAAAAATVPAIGQAAAAPAAASATRPNILLIVTDDQPKQTDWALQKAIGWLAGQGVKFSHGHVTTPLCAPSRSSIFSGRHAHNHGVRNNAASAALDQNTTVQRYLKQAGYRTGLFGKYLNSWNIADAPPHFEDFALLQPGYVDAKWNVNGAVQTINGYTTNIIKNRTLGFLDKAATDTRPWFAYVTPYASHGPRTPRTDPVRPRPSTRAPPCPNGTAAPPSPRPTAATSRPTSRTPPAPWRTAGASARSSCGCSSRSTTPSRPSRTSWRPPASSTTPS